MWNLSSTVWHSINTFNTYILCTVQVTQWRGIETMDKQKQNLTSKTSHNKTDNNLSKEIIWLLPVIKRKKKKKKWTFLQKNRVVRQDHDFIENSSEFRKQNTETVRNWNVKSVGTVFRDTQKYLNVKLNYRFF